MPANLQGGATFGQFLKNLRERRKMTQEELAERTDLNRSYIAQLENDYPKTISIRTLVKLADGLQVDYNELLEASGYFAKITESDDFPTLEAYLRSTMDLSEEAIQEITNHIMYVKQKEKNKK